MGSTCAKPAAAEDDGFKEPEPKPSTKTSDKKLKEADKPGGLFGNSKVGEGGKVGFGSQP